MGQALQCDIVQAGAFREVQVEQLVHPEVAVEHPLQCGRAEQRTLPEPKRFQRDEILLK